ncbi:hypothetical protein GCK72_021271 [Caenorhabditis remanei]|uniref:F-box domain-containing protein n=1 Tax=Caenorhabditis remanei TaxID=31234 RepID=A0A6A5GHK7_CAERE|nr:hypothetical protein GCK72_021271 [Caenorhabditis remanei]KAF1754707.1 hypothetical protein GCK72_021271 [Caenorhabditis remanei]
MTTPFPLLRLPRLALIPVFQRMEIIEVIAFSLISRKTHNLSKSLRKTISSHYIDLEMEINGFRMRIAVTNGSPLALYFYPDDPKTVGVFYRKRKLQWKNVGLSPKQSIERVFDITKCPSLNKLVVNGKTDYDVFSVLDVVPKVSELKIYPNCRNAFSSSITSFEPSFLNRKEFQRVWMRNVDCLCIYDDDLSNVQFNLNDLLASNAVSLELSEVPMSLRDLNRFFSSWLDKTSNHRLEHLSVNTFKDINEDVLMDGLGATRFTENRTRKFRSTNMFPKFTEFTGGFDVRRIDGQLAAITFGHTFWTTYINFDVWP